MRFVFLTALGVGGATVVGGIIGFFLKSIPKKFFDLTLSFAAGIMLAAAVWGLIIPSFGGESFGETAVTVIGITLGAFFVGCCEGLAPKLRFVVGDADTDGCADGAIMLLLAMAIHNLPEGIATGVSLGTGDVAGAVAVATAPRMMAAGRGNTPSGSAKERAISAMSTTIVVKMACAIPITVACLPIFFN